MLKNSILIIALLVSISCIRPSSVYSQKGWKDDCLEFVNGFEKGEFKYTKDDIKTFYQELVNYQLCELDTMSYLRDSIFILKSKHNELPDKIILRLGGSTNVYHGNAYLHVINILSKSSISKCALSLAKIWFIDNMMVGSLEPLKEREWIKQQGGSSSKDLFPSYFYYLH
jgi:hypothetical protein